MTNSNQIQKEIRSAIKESNIKKVVELINSDAERLHIMTPFGTWLHVAASKGELDIVKKLIELGAKINMTGGVYGGTALNEAASAGHIEIVRYLLSECADIDVTEPERNPLFGAISNGHANIARLLIESGIDTTVEYSGNSMSKMNAFTFAKEQGEDNIAKLLLNQSDAFMTENDHHQHQNDKIIDFYEKNFGTINDTINEIIPGSNVSVHVHIIPPSANKDYFTLVTTGMSDEPMDYSNAEKEFKYAELFIKLPSTWVMKKEKMKEKDFYWPIEWLRKVAHIPHMYNGWIEEGVIIPNGEPPQPFAPNTKLSCVMICRPFESEFEVISSEEKKIKVFTLIPIFEEERNIALQKGYDYLLKSMKEIGISDVLDVHRINLGK